MKELSIEEKAKAYDEVREKIAIRFGSNVADKIFSQFEMSEDERIRKALIHYFTTSYNIAFIGDKKITNKDVIAWLEEQGNLVEYYEDKLDRCACDNFNKGYKKALEKQSEQKESYDTCISTTLNNKKLPCGEKRDFGYFEKQGEQKPAWSEEDESMYIRTLGVLGKCYIGELPTKVEEELNWLKSLRPQSTWKPSDQELDAILTVIGDEEQEGSDVAKELLKLYHHLKKLRNE